MKVAKIALMVCAAIALAATYSPAGQYKVTVSGIVYTNLTGSSIYQFKLDNKGIIGLITTNKGAQLLYDTSGESNGTNMVIVAGPCGNPLYQIAILIPNQGTCISATANNVTEQVCSIPFVGLGGEGTVLVDLKEMVTTKGTNLVGKATGVFTALGSPGVISITISGAFKPPTTGCGP